MRYLLFLLVFLCASGSPSIAYTIADLDNEFDARLLSTNEKRFLQAGLALKGDYQALLDGAWGRGSQTALTHYLQKSKIQEPLPNWAVVFLAYETQLEFEEKGWTERYFSTLDMSVLLPTKVVNEGEHSDHYFNLEVTGTSLRYSFSRDADETRRRSHSYTLKSARRTANTYTVRKPKLWITSSKAANGTILYTRSDFRKGAWSTIMLSASTADKGLLATVSGSIQRGRASEIFLPDEELKEGILSLAKLLTEEEQTEERNSPPQRMRRYFSRQPNSAANAPKAKTPPPPNEENSQSSGTGFLVSKNGFILTNEHVISGCSTVSVSGFQAAIAASDPSFDLALLKVPRLADREVAPFAPKPALLNSDITVAGYPLSGLLSGLNVTRGSVTAIKGLGGDASRFQISAPVQPGNSGGPAMNAKGEIVGVVVSKLDAKLLADAIGDIPQNVNFAVHGSIAKLFLYQNNITPQIAESKNVLPPETIAEKLSSITYLVTCQ